MSPIPLFQLASQIIQSFLKPHQVGFIHTFKFNLFAYTNIALINHHRKDYQGDDDG